MRYDSLDELYIDHLRSALGAERRLAAAFLRAMDNASNESLRRALARHASCAEMHNDKVEQVLRRLEGHLAEEAGEDRGPSVAARVEEASESEAGHEVRTVAVLAAAKEAAHQEIACFRILRDLARHFDDEEAIQAFGGCLDDAALLDRRYGQLLREELDLRQDDLSRPGCS